MKYEEACDYMLSLNKRGIHPGLEGIRNLCSMLSNPQDDLKVIQVVGTNGKGSTSLFISEILRASGLRVGVYSSPAVFSDREIIKVNGRDITKEDYVNLIEEISKLNHGCTRFEVETAMAFKHFKNKECDVVVFEAGMGGALDATNVVKTNIASVFASISMDHTDFLGQTIEEIAENKTGVIKDNSVTISTLQDDSVKKIIEEKTSLHNNKCVFADYTKVKKLKYKSDHTEFSYVNLNNISIKLLGTFQVANAVLAIETAKALRDVFKISDEAILKGLKNAKESGRFERIMDKPVFIIDGAHNPKASLVLRDTLNTYFTKKKFIYIMGMLRDKDCETVVKNTVDLADCIFTVATPNKARTLSAFELANIVKPYNPCVTSVDGIFEAVELALMMADKDTVIVGFGSLSHLKEIKDAVKKK